MEIIIFIIIVSFLLHFIAEKVVIVGFLLIFFSIYYMFSDIIVNELKSKSEYLSNEMREYEDLYILIINQLRHYFSALVTRLEKCEYIMVYYWFHFMKNLGRKTRINNILLNYIENSWYIK